MNPQTEPNLQKITIDAQLLQRKQQILLKYYTLDHEPEIIQLIQSWPSSIAESIKREPQVHKTNNAKYFGSTSNDLFHGFGLLIYDNPEGRFYEGEFQNNCKHGNGIEYIRGDVYVGKFVNNKPEDESGVFMWRNGDIFHGVFVNGMKHGYGKWESGNDYYDGLWKFNKPQGQGKIHTKTSDYEGQIKNGYKHGRGVQIFANGDKYDGQYGNGKPEGDGVYHWNNGAVYRGQFKNGIRYGYGQWTYGKEKYQGQYINDKRNGQGVYKWDGGSFYKGQFLDDMRHGYGEMHWSEGAFYKGEWKEGIQSGQGQLWENGKLMSKGLFEEGKFVNVPVKSPQMNHKIIERSTRYPVIQNKARGKSTFQPSFPQETPKSKIKKNVASTSFSHHTRVSRKSENTTSVVPSKLNEERKLYFVKRREKASELSETNSKLNKRKSVKGQMKAALDMTETQLGPIKWKNFKHIKSPNYYGNLPQI